MAITTHPADTMTTRAKFKAIEGNQTTKLAKDRLTSVNGRDVNLFEDGAKPLFAYKFKRAPTTDVELQKFVHTALSAKWHMFVSDAPSTNVELGTKSASAQAWSAKFGRFSYSGEFVHATNEVKVLKTNFPNRTVAEPKKRSLPITFDWHQAPQNETEMRGFVHTALGRNFKGVGDNSSSNVKLGSDINGVRTWNAQYNVLQFNGTLDVATGRVTVQTAGRVKE